MIASHFYRGKICLNVLAKSLDNAKQIYEATEGHVLIGLLSANYGSVKEAMNDITMFDEQLHGAVSVGLGAGNPKQWEMVATICKEFTPTHVNQIFSAVGYTRACVDNQRSSDHGAHDLANKRQTFINSLVQPVEEIGYVNIATGPFSSKGDAIKVPVPLAITLIREMGGNSLKLFPMNGLTFREQYIAVATACAEEGFALEPTGGIDVQNFEEIISIALNVGVKQIIPHVYSSIIDGNTGETRIEDIRTLYQIIQKVGDIHGD